MLGINIVKTYYEMVVVVLSISFDNFVACTRGFILMSASSTVLPLTDDDANFEASRTGPQNSD